MQFDNYRIRLLEMNDLDNYFRMVEKNRKRLEDFFTGTVSRTNTYGDTKNFLAENIQKSKDRLYFPYIIEDINNGLFIGFLDIKNIDWNIPKAELGCYTDADHAGKGLTSKAFSIFTQHCFDTYGFLKLFLRTHQDNKAAQKLAESNGFEIEGRIRKDYKTTKGEVVDLIYYGKIRQE